MDTRDKFNKIDLRLARTDEPPPYGGAIAMRCPIKEKHKRGRDNTPSLYVYPDNIHCFGCGFHISRRRIYAALAVVLEWWDGKGDDDGHWQRAAAVINRYSTDSLDNYRERAADKAMATPLDIAVAEAYHQNLMQNRAHRVAWLTDRGIHPAIIKDRLLGHDGTRFTIPVFDHEGRLLTIRFRRDDNYPDLNDDGEDTRPKYKGMTGRNGTFLYGVNVLDRDNPVVDAVEGELDQVILRQYGHNVVSTTNGARQCYLIPKLLEDVGYVPTKVRILTDHDEAGDEAAVRLSQECESRGIDWERGVWYTDAKDITEFIQQEGYVSDELYFGQWWCNTLARRTQGAIRGREQRKRSGQSSHPRLGNVGRKSSGEGLFIRLDSFGTGF